MFDSLNKNSYGQYDYLIETLAPALGKKGLEHLKLCMVDLSKMPVEKPPNNERKVIGWGSGGEVYEDEMEENRRGWIPCEWKQTRLDVLDSLGHKDEAQKFRWACFESDLDSSHLKDYLKPYRILKISKLRKRLWTMPIIFLTLTKHYAFLFHGLIWSVLQILSSRRLTR